MAGKPKASKHHPGANAPGKKTVGVYDRPPQRRNRKLLLAVIIALALVFSILFLVRLSQGRPVQGVEAAGSEVALIIPDQRPPASEETRFRLHLLPSGLAPAWTVSRSPGGYTGMESRRTSFASRLGWGCAKIRATEARSS
jgi:hypothetical protein